MRLLHAADLHIGDRTYGFDRTSDHAALLAQLARDAEGLGVDAVILAGDVFDNRHPSSRDLYVFASAIARVAKVCPVIVTPGNHDGSQVISDPTKTTGWLSELGIPGIHSLPLPSVSIVDTRAGPLCVTSLPYAHKRSLPGGREEVSRTLERIIEDLPAPDVDAPRVFVGHLSTLGTFLSEGSAMRMGWDVAIRPEVLERFDYAALGHIHRQQQVGGNAWYAGVPMQMRFEQEGWDAGWLLVDVERGKAEVSAVSGRGPAFITVRDSYDALMGHDPGDALGNAYVRFQVTGKVSPGDIARLAQRAVDRGAKGVNIVPMPPERSTRARVDVKAEVRPDDILALWLQAQQLPPEPYLSAGRDMLAAG